MIPMRDSNIQVISVGNAYELVCREERAYDTLSELARIDEVHFGQKAALWDTPYGPPRVTICTRRQSDALLGALFYSSAEAPLFIQPVRASSSICSDLLADSNALSSLRGALDRRRPVYLAPYVHTTQVETLARWLMRAGFELYGFKLQSAVVQSLRDKTFVEHNVFGASQRLRQYRPRCLLARSIHELRQSCRVMARAGIAKVVIKSANAVGGAGTYYVEASRIEQVHGLDDLLLASGSNEPDRAFPFVVEECVPWQISPSVDIHIDNGGEASLVGVGLQRLYDRRYYIGFCYSPEMKAQRWYGKVVGIALDVGRQLAAMGFQGPANVDFIVSDEDVFLVEVNPRRSALLDGYSLAARRNGAWDRMPISVADYVRARVLPPPSLRDGLSCDGAFDAEVLSLADGGIHSKYQWLSTWISGRSLRTDTESALERYVELVGVRPDNDGESEDVGRIFTRIAGIAA